MLPHGHRLRRNADIRRVRQQGRRWYHPLLILFVEANNQETSRFAVSVGRHVGGAVVRNRAKRRIREVIRRYLKQVKGGYDCLLIVRADLPVASFAEIEAAVSELLRRAGLLS